MTSVCTDQIPAAAESVALSLGYSSLKPEQRDVIVEFVLGSGVQGVRHLSKLRTPYSYQITNQQNLEQFRPRK